MKYILGIHQVKFWDDLVDKNGTRPLPEKVAAIQEFKKSENLKELRRFLGVINFYRRFIPGAAKDQATLNELLKNSKENKKKSIEWTSDLEQTFEKCKESLPKATLLARSYPDANGALQLTTDASDTAIDAVIEQIVGT